MRVDLYGAIHKAQRFHLFQLAVDIAAADFTSPHDAERIAARIAWIIEHLRDHARNEETYIHPLFANGDAGARLHDEHDDLDAAIAGIERILEERRWDDLYPQFTRFIGTYLLHLSAEEEAQRDVLWRRYGDESLMAVMRRFKAERSPHAAAADLEFMSSAR